MPAAIFPYSLQPVTGLNVREPFDECTEFSNATRRAEVNLMVFIIDITCSIAVTVGNDHE